MNITNQQKTRVQNSFALVAPIAEQAAVLFYKRLFELDPSLRTLFTEEMSKQRTKLMQTLEVAVEGLDSLETLVPVLENLAIRHIGYGVRTEHYHTVGQALLWTLEQGLGADFTEDVRHAWSAVYNLISTVMISAAEKEYA